MSSSAPSSSSSPSPSFLRQLVPPPGPVRVLCASNLAKTAGNGVLLSVSVVFFIRSVGIPATQVGLALTIAAALGMLASVPAGHAADVLGPRNTAVVFICLMGPLVWGYTLVHGFVSLLVAASLVIVTDSALEAARGALIAGIVAPGERVLAWSYLRSISNIGISLGAVGGGVALHYDTRGCYVGLLLAAGALFVVAGLAYLAVPSVAPVEKPAESARWIVHRDRPFVVVSLLNTVLVMNGGLLTVALPIWITERTDAPTAVYSVILLLNTVMVVLFQVRVSKGSEDVPGGARALRRSGLVLAVCCLLFAAAGGAPTSLAVTVLLAGALVHVLGEMLYSAGSWSLSFGLAPEHAQGQYQGLFGMSTQLGAMVTPVAATTLIIGLGWSGWLVFAAVLAAAGACVPVVAGRTPQGRPSAPAVPEAVVEPAVGA